MDFYNNRKTPGCKPSGAGGQIQTYHNEGKGYGIDPSTLESFNKSEFEIWKSTGSIDAGGFTVGRFILLKDNENNYWNLKSTIYHETLHLFFIPKSEGGSGGADHSGTAAGEFYTYFKQISHEDYGKTTADYQNQIKTNMYNYLRYESLWFKDKNNLKDPNYDKYRKIHNDHKEFYKSTYDEEYDGE